MTRYSHPFLLTMLLSLFPLRAQPAQSVETQTFVAAPGDSVVVVNDHGRVRVSTWNEPHVEVRARRIAASTADLGTVLVDFRRTGAKIHVQTSFLQYAAQSVYIDVQMPDFMGLVVWGTNPAVEVYGLDGHTRVHTLTGLVTAADLTASTSLATDSGDILYYANQQPRGDVRLETVRGNIRCHVNPDLNLRNWMRAGRTLTWNDEIEMSQGSLEKQVGIGGPLLYANSAGGGVRFLLSGAIDTDVLASRRPTAARTTAQPTSTTESTPSRRPTGRPPAEPPVQRTPAEPRTTTPPVLGSDDNGPEGLPEGRSSNDRAAPGPPPQAPQTRATGTGSPVFKVGVDWVYLNASVRDRRTNRAVPNLSREDFDLYEDGVQQQIERFDSTEAPFTLLMLLDVSGSTREYLDDVKEASIDFTRRIKESDRVAIASFNSRSRLRSDFTNDRGRMAETINDLRSGGGTAFYDALAMSVGDYLQGIEGRKAIVVFTDGVDNRLTGQYSEGSHIEFRQLYRLVEESDTLIYTIFLDTEDDYGQGRRRSSVEKILEDILNGGGRRPPPNPRRGGDPAYEEARRQLQAIADQTGGRLYAPRRIRDLSQAFSEIADDLRVQYTLGYSSTNPQQDQKWRDIRLKVKRPGLAVRTRKGYYAGDSTPNP